VLAQEEIEHLMSSRRYSVYEAREVALAHYILLKPEQAEEDDQDREAAENEGGVSKKAGEGSSRRCRRTE
jgi:hypothetical protein